MQCNITTYWGPAEKSTFSKLLNSHSTFVFCDVNRLQCSCDSVGVESYFQSTVGEKSRQPKILYSKFVLKVTLITFSQMFVGSKMIVLFISVKEIQLVPASNMVCEPIT